MTFKLGLTESEKIGNSSLCIRVYKTRLTNRRNNEKVANQKQQIRPFSNGIGSTIK